MKHLLAYYARKFRSWLTRETKSEIRSAQQLSWITRHLDTPIPSTVVSLQPTTINWVINEIIINQRKFVVELGAGTSTQIIAQGLSLLHPKDKIDRTFISIEENEFWASHVQMVINTDNNKEHGQVKHVSRKNGPGGFWYDEDRIIDILGDNKVDLLIIDGPAIKRVKQNADRSRVFEFFKDRMAEEYTVFIDDTTRKAERALSNKWAKHADSSPTYLNAYLGVVRKGDGFNSQPN